MKLMRHDPFAVEWPLSRFFREFPDLRWPSHMLVEEDVLKVEEFTEDGTLVIRAEMPGIDPDKDVDLEVAEGRLSIRAERRKEEETEGREYYRREMEYGAFGRSLPLPAGATEADVKATYKDGILEIRVPIEKEKAAGATKIHVERPD